MVKAAKKSQRQSTKRSEPDTSATWAPIDVERSSTGVVREPERGIRQKLVSMLREAGDKGLTEAELESAWEGKDPSKLKVASAMRILASDAYGFKIQLVKDPVDKSKSRWRLVD